MTLTNTTISAADGLKLFYYCWQPDMRGEGSSARAVVVVVHGVTEHCGRYDELAARFNRQGIVVCGYDLRGHGHSEGPRVDVSRFEEYLDDLDLYAAQVRNRFPDLPLFIFGHSMGGAIVARWAIERKPSIAGLLLSAPAVRIGSGVAPWLRYFARIGSWLAPRLKILRLGATGLSRDQAVVAQFRADPLVHHGTFRIRMGTEILRSGRIIEQRAAELDCPLFAMHGTADRATDPRGTQAVFDRAASFDKTFIQYPDLYHDLVHEPEKDRVFSDVTNWVMRRI